MPVFFNFSPVQTHLKNVHDEIVAATAIPNPPAPSQRSSFYPALHNLELAPTPTKKAPSPSRHKKVKTNTPSLPSLPLYARARHPAPLPIYLHDSIAMTAVIATAMLTVAAPAFPPPSQPRRPPPKRKPLRKSDVGGSHQRRSVKPAASGGKPGKRARKKNGKAASIKSRSGPVELPASQSGDLSRDPEPDTVVIRTNVAQPAATIPSMVARASFSKNMGMYGERVQAYTRLIVPSRDDRPWQPRSTDVRRRSPGASIPGGGYPPHQPLQDEYIVRAFDDVSDDDSIIMSPPPPTPPSVAVECSWPAAQTESRLETIDRGVEHRVARPPAANDPIPLTPSPAASYMARQASTKIKTHAPRQLFSPVLQ